MHFLYFEAWYDVILEQQSHSEKNGVHGEHDESHGLVHLPLEASDKEDDEEEHSKEEDDGAK